MSQQCAKSMEGATACAESLGRNEIGTLFQDREEAHVPMEDRVKERKIEDEI